MSNQMQTHHRKYYLKSTRMVEIKKMHGVNEETEQKELSYKATENRNRNNHLGKLIGFIIKVEHSIPYDPAIVFRYAFHKIYIQYA